MDDNQFVIIKGFIDGRDEKLTGVYGVFLGVASSLEVKFLKVYFSETPIDREQGYPALLALFRKDEASPAGEELSLAKTRLEKFISDNKLLQTSTKSMNNKAIEQPVSHFCSEELKWRSVTFVELKEAEDDEVALFAAGGAPREKRSEDFGFGDKEGGTDEEGEQGDKDTQLFVALEPILDPVSGVAASELAVGDRVDCRLPESSVYFKLFTGVYPDFDGTMTGKVLEIKISELGTAIVVIYLAEGISGMLKLSGSIRVRLAGRGGGVPGLLGNERDFPFGLVFGSLGVILLLIVVLLYFLS